jgi:predicted PurR-regulated permease PerM
MRDSLNGRRDTHDSSTALTIIAFGVVIAGLVYGRPFLLPLALAIFLWKLMEAMVQGFSSVEIAYVRAPRWLATLLGILTVGMGCYLIFSVLLGPVAGHSPINNPLTTH